ncbi:dienelactone hydrolase family protein [Microlunatus sp. Gsoil 973]|uniref:dienelactone hydrolase family protein n=1 Tax=Microlunatus sp. Gsoil 973 TaxID=2672569 RepID=UPI0012B4BFB1|nr:dienelactone hydrolase family protein [Microlunatus sp. Gsoil 973]QGN33514.1 dienelactone hydrolase family protein [Microlunatus sp. Gsoil 973]
MSTAGADAESQVDIYRAVPSGEIKGGLIVIHEIWGLVDHIESVADRFAAAGYVAYAPDILSHAGITPRAGRELLELMQHPDEKVRVAAQPTFRERMAPAHDPQYGGWALHALTGVVDDLAGQPGVDGRMGVVGFCFGGTYSFGLAATDPRIRAAVPFYGAPPDQVSVSTIRRPVLAIYGGDDERLISGLPEVTRRMHVAGVDFTTRIYPGAGHAFFNDSGSNYDAEAAADAWAITVEFLARNL